MNKQNAQVPSLQSVYEQLEHFWKGLNIYNGYYEYRTVTSIMFGLGSRLRQFSNNTIDNFVPNPYGLFIDNAIEKTYNPVEDINISLNSTGDWLNKMPLTSTYEMTKRKEYVVTIAGIVKSTSNGIEGYILNPEGNDGKVEDNVEVNDEISSEVNGETVTEPSESETVTEPEAPAESEQPEIPSEPEPAPVEPETEQPSESETETEPEPAPVEPETEQPSESETVTEPEPEIPTETEQPEIPSEPESPVDIIENEAETASEEPEPAPKKRGRRRKTE